MKMNTRRSTRLRRKTYFPEDEDDSEKSKDNSDASDDTFGAGSSKSVIDSKPSQHLRNINEAGFKCNLSSESDSDSSSDSLSKRPKSSDINCEQEKTSLPSYLDHKLSDTELSHNSGNESGFHEDVNVSEYYDFTPILSQQNYIENEATVKEEPSCSIVPKNKEKLEKMDVCELLALGEKTKIDKKVIKKLASVKPKVENYEIPKQVEVLVKVPENLKHKKPTDLEQALKRRLNMIRQETQEYIHKVSLLCWIAYGNYINKLLNDAELMSIALSLLPNDKCYPKKHTDLTYLEDMVKWFAKKVPVDKTCSDTLVLKTPPSLDSLKMQFQKLAARNKQNLVLMFICVLRALGIKSRLIINLNVAPKKLNKADLLSTSVKKEENLSYVKNDQMVPKSKEKIPCFINADSNIQLLNQVTTKKPKIVETQNENKIDVQKFSKNNSGELMKSNKSSAKDKGCSPSKSHTLHGDKSRVLRGTKRNSNQSQYFNDTKSPEHITEVNQKLNKANNQKEHISKDDKSHYVDTILLSNPANRLKKDGANDKSSHCHFHQEDPTDSYEKSRTNSAQELKADKEKKKNPRIERHLRQKKGPDTESKYFEQNSDKTEQSSQNKGKGNQLRNKYNSKKSSDHSKLKTKMEEKCEHSKKEKVVNIERKRSSNRKVNKKSMVEEMLSDDSESDFVTPVKKKIDRRVLSSDDEQDNIETKPVKKVDKKDRQDYWTEVFLEEEESWICVDISKGSYLCAEQLYNNASQPIRYILAWNPDQTIKDVTRRYDPNWLTQTRKLRVSDDWWSQTMVPYKPLNTAHNRDEDEELDKKDFDQPLPSSVSDFKNHPLYALKRHLLKFQAIYPPDTKVVGYVKGEPVYPRSSIHQLHGREMWIKEAKVVRIGETPYKIVKGRPKKDKFGSDIPERKDVELFGKWQIEDYVPPEAKNGIVPRNAFGNVELFKMCMLPKGTTYLRVPGLLRVANKLKIDCAPAVTGFEFKNGFSYPVKEGFVVCEEFVDIMLDAFNQEMEEMERKESEKRRERAVKNWKKLLKLIRIQRKLKRKYNFGNLDHISENEVKPKRKPKIKKCQ